MIINDYFWQYKYNHSKESFWAEGYIYLYLPSSTKDYEAYKDYILIGKKLGRSNGVIPPSDIFFSEGYYYLYRDEIPSGVTAWMYYVQNGRHKGHTNGLNPPANIFFAEGYLMINPDVKASKLDPWKHYILNGIGEGRSNGLVPPANFFFKEGYLKIYPDVQTLEIDPWRHYVLYGSKEGRTNGLTPPSDIFFSEGYLFLNQDVKDSGTDPWRHYVLYGSNEGRGNGLVPPSDIFDSEGYLNTYDDVKNSKVDPWKHYVIHGFKEGRSNGVHHQNDDITKTALNYRLLLKNVSNYLSINEIDIILPIYNGYKYLESLFNSIKLNTDIKYNLIIVNDCSTDLRVNKIIDDFFKHENNVTILQNSSNLGFVKSVNKALELTNNDVILLNSDVVLPKGWATRLMYPILNDNSVASVTPFSNAATIFSIPEIDKNNTLDVDLEILNSNIKDFNIPFNDLRFATGVGFCMAMSRKALDEVGYLDEIFDKGYGEENDWCQRAIQKGFYNTIAGNLFVWHKHGGSFQSDEKIALCRENQKVITSKYPNYAFDIQSNFNNSVFISLRFFIIAKYYKIKFSKTIVVFDHSWGGGTETYINRRIDNIKNDTFIIRIQYKLSTSEYILTMYGNSLVYSLAFEDLCDVFKFIEDINPNSLVINNLAGYNIFNIINQILDLHCRNPQIKIIYKMHDFQCICPSVNMISKGLYCNNKGDRSRCSKCWDSCKYDRDVPINCESVQQYQQFYALLMNVVSEIDFFSQSSYEIVKNWFDINDKYTITPHFVPPLRKVVIKPHNNCNVAIVGNIGVCKGYNILKQIDDHLVKYDGISMYLFGKAISPFTNIKNLGRYEISNLPDLFEKFQIDLVLFTSICPETFSYVVSEIIFMDVPIACFDLGAQQEKILKYDKGYVLRSYEPDYILKFILSFHESCNR